MSMKIYQLIATQILKVLSKLPGAAENNVQKQYLKLVGKTVCYNQGKIADYSFATNERHRRLRHCYQHILNSQGAATDDDYRRLKDAYRSISNGLVRALPDLVC